MSEIEITTQLFGYFFAARELTNGFVERHFLYAIITAQSGVQVLEWALRGEKDTAA